MTAEPAAEPEPESPAPAARWVGAGLLLTAALLWSVAGLAVKRAGGEGVAPLAFTALRSAGAAAAMLPLLGLGAKLTGAARPRAALMLPVAGCYTVMVGAFVVSSAWGTAAAAILLQYSAPVWAALLGWLLFGRRVKTGQTAALVLAAAGVGVLLAAVWGENEPGSAAAPAGALAILSGLAYAGVIVGVDAVDADARRRTGGPANAVAVVFWNNLLAALVLAPWAAWRGDFSISLPTAGVLLVLGVWQMALPYVLFQLGLRRTGPVAAGLIVLIEPVLSPVWAFLGAGERPPDAAYPGGALILAAVALGVWTGRRGRRAERAATVRERPERRAAVR